MKVIACVNQKGGVGKTTWSFHLTEYLRKKKHKVLGVDVDSQGNYSLIYAKKTCGALEIFAKTPHLLVEPAREGVPAHEFGIVTSDSRLSQAEGQVGVGTFSRLQRLLRNETNPWEYAVVDCPPSLGVFTINALAAADHVVILTKPQFFSVVGIQNLMERISEVRGEGLNPGIKVAGIVLNEGSRTTVTADAVGTLAMNFPNLTVKTMIPASVKVEEAIQRGMPMWDYAPGHAVSEAIVATLNEIWARISSAPAAKSDEVAA